MNKIAKIILIVILFGVLICTWWVTPTKMVRISHKDVQKIEIFNGSTGEDIVISDRSEIEHIINNLKTISFKKEKISIGYMGYSFRTTIYKTNGGVYKQFIINSKNTIRKDPFFYKDSSGSIDYKYIETLFENQNE
ncbi:hypothetical protein [Paenibacillus sp. GCM10028914]|uniref:hypothetical protein n=1 Tax=Paenibacillus sp. GCM10028914 TaxID=3273416 RepID=UPI0036167014